MLREVTRTKLLLNYLGSKDCWTTFVVLCGVVRQMVWQHTNANIAANRLNCEAENKLVSLTCPP